jgi:Periplasmic binding protein
MAIDEINGAGGVLGKKIEVVSRDDGGNPGDAVRVGQATICRSRIDCRSARKWGMPCSANSRKSSESYGGLYSTPTGRNCIICAALARNGTLSASRRSQKNLDGRVSY